ncbi:MAG: PqqD family protein [Anaeromyxobacteraceae bacterium]
MTDKAAPTPNPQALFTELDDGTGVLLHLDTKFYYTLNPTAVFVWKALGSAAARSVASIAQDLIREFRVERSEAERDVTRILDEMIADGLVIERPA